MCDRIFLDILPARVSLFATGQGSLRTIFYNDMALMTCRWTLFQLVVLTRGHLRQTKTDPVYAVSASVNADSQIDISEAQLQNTDVHTQTHMDSSVGFKSLSDSLDYLQNSETQNVSQSGGRNETIETTEERSGGGWQKNVTLNHKYVVKDGDFESPFPFVMINLDRRKDRLQKMETTLPPWVCAKTCRVPASDSDNKQFTRPHYVPEEAWKEAHAREALGKGHRGDWQKYGLARDGKSLAKLLTPGAIALIDSSRRVWEQIILTNTITIVMEDDIVVADPLQLFNALSDLQKRTDWDMVYLQYGKGKRGRQQNPQMLKGAMTNLGMYALTPVAALKLRDALEKGTWKASQQLDGTKGGEGGIFKSVLDKNMIFHFYPAVAFQFNASGQPDFGDIQLFSSRGPSTCGIKACESGKEDGQEKKTNMTSSSTLQT